MLGTCKYLFGTGKTVVFDSGFCVAKSINNIESKGVHVGYIIKNQPYWPKVVPGEFIDAHFKNKEDGDVDMIDTKPRRMNHSISSVWKIWIVWQR